VVSAERIPQAADKSRERRLSMTKTKQSEVMKPKVQESSGEGDRCSPDAEKMTLAENDPASLLEGEVEDLTVTADLIRRRLT